MNWRWINGIVRYRFNGDGLLYQSLRPQLMLPNQGQRGGKWSYSTNMYNILQWCHSFGNQEMWLSRNTCVFSLFRIENQCQVKILISDVLVDDLGFPSQGWWQGVSIGRSRFQWSYCFLPWSIICVLVTIWAFNIRLLQKWFGSMEAWGDIVFLMECLMPPPIIFIASRQKITFDEIIEQDIWQSLGYLASSYFCKVFPAHIN